MVAVWSGCWGSSSAEAATELATLFGTTDVESLRSLTADGVLELRPGASALLAQISEAMPSGSVVTIDYGDWYDDPAPRAASSGAAASGADGGFRPADHLLKARGSRRRSLRGYFRHQMSDDPLERVGRQDLTADVDFRALDLHGRRLGFETVVYSDLASFLRAAGVSEGLVTPRELPCCILSDPLEADRQATVLDALLDEQGLGGSYKVMVQVRD